MRRITTFTIIVLMFMVTMVSQTSNKTAVATGILPICTAAQHDHPVYGMTTAPDGNKYPTWTPQVSGSGSGCHYGHEHGTNPAVLFQSGWRPPFGYAATVANGQPMFHEGYKGVGFYSGDYAWYITIHQGSSEPGAVCARYHDLGVYVENALTGERMAEIYYMADFGYAARNTDGAPFTPATCPNRGAGVNGNGIRQFGVVDDANFASYNPWRVDSGQNAAGFDADSLTIWVDSIKLPYDLQVSQFVDNPATSNSGTKRLVQYYAEMGFVNSPATGEFCTDPYAMNVIDCEESDAVRQYINPDVVDLRPELPGQKCNQRDPHSQLYICGNNAYDPWAWGNYDLFGGIGDKN